MKTVILVVTFMFAFATTSAFATASHTITTWDCGDVTLTSDLMPNHESASGTVTVMDYTFDAEVHRDGLGIRWDFNNEHSMSLFLDGYVHHYDWSGAEVGEMREPQESFKCKVVNQD